MTNIIKITAMALLPLLPIAWHAAQGAETTVVTLSCDGTITNARASEAKPEPINKMGLVVNLVERTVSGFADIVAHVDKIDTDDISFSSTGNLVAPGRRGSIGSITVMGEIDGVTGAVSAKTFTTTTVSTYDLLCKPANRLF